MRTDPSVPPWSWWTPRWEGWSAQGCSWSGAQPWSLTGKAHRILFGSLMSVMDENPFALFIKMHFRKVLIQPCYSQTGSELGRSFQTLNQVLNSRKEKRRKQPFLPECSMKQDYFNSVALLNYYWDALYVAPRLCWFAFSWQ